MALKFSKKLLCMQKTLTRMNASHRNLITRDKQVIYSNKFSLELKSVYCRGKFKNLT